MSLTAQEAFKKSILVSDESLYVLVKLPPTAIWAAAGILAQFGEAFSALIADKDETTLVFPTEAWEEFGSRLPNADVSEEYRLISFDLVLNFDLVGYMAIVSQVLAHADVPIMAFSAFSRDHILVPAQLFQKAWDALRVAQEA